MKIYGVDFTSAPTRDKPIVVAVCEAEKARLELSGFLEHSDWPAFERWLRRDEAWIAGFDFPFGLPRAFVAKQRWPADWPGMVDACVAAGKERFVETAMRAFQGARTVSDKHRATDLKAGSESPLKTKANPPVGRMFYEGAWRLLSAGVHVPVHHETGSPRIALEVYPGLLVRRLGFRYYKNDRDDSAARNGQARLDILARLCSRRPSDEHCAVHVAGRGLRAKMAHASGDWLDALLCAVSTHWAWLRLDQRFGIPDGVDPVEGWIISA